MIHKQSGLRITSQEKDYHSPELQKKKTTKSRYSETLVLYFKLVCTTLCFPNWCFSTVTEIFPKVGSRSSSSYVYVVLPRRVWSTFSHNPYHFTWNKQLTVNIYNKNGCIFTWDIMEVKKMSTKTLVKYQMSI